MKDATEILIILDKSGSMGTIQKDTIGSFNTFLSSQKENPGEANLSLVLFDTDHYTVHSSKPIKEVIPLDAGSYRPSGCTALLDAIGNGINTLGNNLADINEEERPDKVIVIIITDGLENSSKEYNKARIKDMITHQQEKYKWQFIFLGANVDSFHEAQSIGISAQNAGSYGATVRGIASVGVVMRSCVAQYRATGSVSDNWSQDLVDDSTSKSVDPTSNEDPKEN